MSEKFSSLAEADGAKILQDLSRKALSDPKMIKMWEELLKKNALSKNDRLKKSIFVSLLERL